MVAWMNPLLVSGKSVERDKQVWLEEFGGKKDNKVSQISHATALNMLHQAALKEQAVTQSDEWNYYLTQLQAVLNNALEYKRQLMVSMQSPDLINTDHIGFLRAQVFIVNARIETLEAVINLPKQIMSFVQDAKLELESYDLAESVPKLDA